MKQESCQYGESGPKNGRHFFVEWTCARKERKKWALIDEFDNACLSFEVEW